MDFRWPIPTSFVEWFRHCRSIEIAAVPYSPRCASGRICSTLRRFFRLSRCVLSSGLECANLHLQDHLLETRARCLTSIFAAVFRVCSQRKAQTIDRQQESRRQHFRSVPDAVLRKLNLKKPGFRLKTVRHHHRQGSRLMGFATLGPLVNRTMAVLTMMDLQQDLVFLTATTKGKYWATWAMSDEVAAQLSQTWFASRMAVRSFVMDLETTVPWVHPTRSAFRKGDLFAVELGTHFLQCHFC